MDTNRKTQVVKIVCQFQPSPGCSSAMPGGKDCSGHAVPSNMSSMEESEPPSPTFGPPSNFAEVIPGIYRSSFPRTGNFDHLRSLRLKTILTLVAEDYPSENRDFVTANSIKHVQISIPANKDAFDSIPLESMAKALVTICDKRNHPVLVHCNKGKHRTGCVIGCFRKMNDWTMGSIVEEYRSFAGMKARILDEKYIECFDEHRIITKLETLVREMATKRRPLLTPPRSVENDAMDDSLIVRSDSSTLKTHATGSC